MIPLITGDPRDGASFSRFVLPFAYSPEPTEPPVDGGPVFRRLSAFEDGADEDDDAAGERLRYPTTETARVLFRRARWWRLEASSVGDEGAVYRFPIPRRRGGEAEVIVGPPILVLFEFDVAYGRRARNVARPDLLASGFLILDLCFDAGKPAPDLEDLLELNELFRYWREPFSGHSERFCRLLGDHPIDPCTGGAGTLGDADPKAPYAPRWTAFLDRPLQLAPGDHLCLFPTAWKHASAILLDRPVADAGPGWAVYADTRAFVWTAAVLDQGLETLAKRFGEGPAASYGHWIKLLNVDRPGTAPEKSAGFERDWVAECTYCRWEEAATLYGFTYHSGAMLTREEPELPLVRHFAGMYFDQALLLLYLRVTTFRFSRELSAISESARSDGENADAWREAFRRLRRDFMLFTNLYQFPLVTNQQQGVELYTKARAALDVDQLFAEVQQEVHGTHDYFEIEVTQRLTDVNTRLAVGAAVGLPLALATGFLGMNVLGADPGAEILTFTSRWWTAAGVGATLLVSFAVVLAAMRWPKAIVRLVLPEKQKEGRR